MPNNTPTQYALDFGAYLRHLRIDVYENSLREFATRLGISHGYLGRLELGQVGVPRRKTVISMADHVVTDVDTLLLKAGYAPVNPVASQEFDSLILKLRRLRPDMIPAVVAIIDNLSQLYPADTLRSVRPL